MSYIISIANQKGGVGKTTTTISMSACLAELGYKVLLVDLDPQGNSTSGLGIEKHQDSRSVYDAIIRKVTAKEIIVKTKLKNLSVLQSSIELAGAEVELVSMMAREQVLKGVLNSIKDDFDLIFIDCPPSLGLLTINALTASDALIVPIQCEYFALEGLTQLMNTIQLVKLNLNPSLKVEGVVLTMYDKRTNLSNQVVKEVKKFFETDVYRTVIPRSIRLGEAPSYGMPINVYAPSSNAALAYISLSKEFAYAYEKTRKDK